MHLGQLARGVLAGSLALAPLTAWADAESGIDDVDHGLDIDLNVVCAITLNITAEDSTSSGATLLSSTGFVGGATSDTITFDNVVPTGPSRALTGSGGNQYDYGSGVRVIGELQYTVTHSCSDDPVAQIELTTAPSAGTVRYDTVHHGSGWATSQYNQVTASAADISYSSTTGEGVLDLGLEIPDTVTEGTVSAGVLISVTKATP